MTFEEKISLNRQAYLAAKADNKSLNAEVAARNNTKNIIVTQYNKAPNNCVNRDTKKRR